jgi:sec-independent protein translocase protein TatA
MPFIGHLPQMLFLLVIALLVFGPKRMIEMGASLGKAFRELRESIKDIPGMEGFGDLGGLLRNNEPRRTPFSTASQFAQNVSVESEEAPAEASAQPAASPSTPAAEPAVAAGGAPTPVGQVVEARVEPAADERAE